MATFADVKKTADHSIGDESPDNGRPLPSKTRSIWDDNVDNERVKKLSGRDRHKLFPNDYASDGNPYGDY